LAEVIGAWVAAEVAGGAALFMGGAAFESVFFVPGQPVRASGRKKTIINKGIGIRGGRTRDRYFTATPLRQCGTGGCSTGKIKTTGSTLWFSYTDLYHDEICGINGKVGNKQVKIQNKCLIIIRKY